MATEADTGEQVETSDVSRSIGRLEGKMDAMEKGLQDVRDAVLDVHRRIDLLFYAILAASAGMVGAIFASRFVG